MRSLFVLPIAAAAALTLIAPAADAATSGAAPVPGCHIYANDKESVTGSLFNDSDATSAVVKSWTVHMSGPVAAAGQRRSRYHVTMKTVAMPGPATPFTIRPHYAALTTDAVKFAVTRCWVTDTLGS